MDNKNESSLAAILADINDGSETIIVPAAKYDELIRISERMDILARYIANAAYGIVDNKIALEIIGKAYMIKEENE